ncbi:putative ABC transport system permease protein [Halomicrobium zhouii]|uniref:Putative ABC transport system permease protein n=1 Tax=Halomicrobium zhouii TaxID=767519 RepID=A0A1I6K8M6_9EURY|nr:ABC transporter permease [Halomicrobium zhouii]SFR87220.1 putative ABC transport system permease protein [Halomicrobium zhouii]
MIGSRFRAVLGIAAAQLRHERGRTLLAIVAVALAVLATTILASVGYGVVETGQEKFDTSGRDLWVTGGPLKFSPGSVGGFENTLVDSHSVADDIEQREEIQTAVPMSFQTVYASTDGEEFQTVVGVGAPARGPSVNVIEGSEFSTKDTHYANGTYDGPMSHEIVIDERTADQLGVEVGDSLYVGGTLSAARQNEFEVVGISNTFSTFVGSATVTMHLSELQEVTGTTDSDRATFVSIDVHDDADVEQVEREIQAEYPSYDVRTNEEQLEATLREQAVLIASGISLVAFAVAAGVALTTNLQFSLVYQRRDRLAAIKAIGWRTRTLVAVTTVKALVVGIMGAGLGLVLTYPGVAVVNEVAAAIAGFEGLVQLSPEILVGGLVLGVVISFLSGLAASALIARVSPLEYISR